MLVIHRPNADNLPKPLGWDFVNPVAHLGTPDLYPFGANGRFPVWTWAISEPKVAVPLKAGIPTLHHLSQNSFGNNNSLFSQYPQLFLTGCVVIVVAQYVSIIPYFDCDFTTNRRGWGRLSNNLTMSLRVSWTMKPANDAPAAFTGCFLRSVYYRNSSHMKYLTIPSNGTAFFTSFISHTQDLWLEQAAKSRAYMLHNVCDSLFIYA